jgi:anti-repressor protein
MNELVTTKNGKAITTSLKVAEVFERQHRTVLESIRDLECSADFTQQNFLLSEYKDSTGRTLPVYELTRDGFTFLAMGFTGSKAAQFKEDYIKAFNLMETRLIAKQDSYIIADPIERAKRWIEEQQEALLMKPKAEYFDALVDRNLLTNFRETAKELKVKESYLIQWLLDKRYLYRDIKGKLQPYAQYVPALFELKEYRNPKTDHVGNQTLVTPKGRETFRLLIA